jgi:hypothetical protein
LKRYEEEENEKDNEENEKECNKDQNEDKSKEKDKNTNLLPTLDLELSIFKDLNSNNYNQIKIIKELLVKLEDFKIIQKEKYDELNLDLIEYRKLIFNSLDDTILNHVNNSLNCTICFQNEIAICINPCGHTFCISCAHNIKKKCFICNSDCKNKIKIFISGKSIENDKVLEEELINQKSINNRDNMSGY